MSDVTPDPTTSPDPDALGSESDPSPTDTAGERRGRLELGDAHRLVPDGEATPAPGLLSRAGTPWIVVALAVVAIVAIVITGRDDRVSTVPQAAGSGNGSKACAGFSYGANLLGEPRVAEEPGVHIWQDIDGFHLRLVPGDGIPASITGTMSWEGSAPSFAADGPIGTVEANRVELHLDADARDLDFKVPCPTSKLVFDLQADGAPLAGGVVTVGRGDVAVPPPPVVLVRGS